MAPVPWRVATRSALYGPDGFFVRAGGSPAAHFRTSVHASALFARAVLAVARASGLRSVVDVGAGGGELLSALRALDPALLLAAVELAGRPPELAEEVRWSDDLASLTGHLGDALVVANEWLDDVPVDVVQVTDGDVRVVLVDPVSGAESLGPAVSGADAAWLAEWWPLDPHAEGVRAELGRPRDEAWMSVVARLGRGLAVAVDYGHLRAARPAFGSLTAYRSGRQVEPVPDGSCDITAHVALDSVAAAGVAAGAEWTAIVTQRAALHALHQPPGRPSYEEAHADPAGALRALTATGEWAELVDPGGLGGFGWLVQGVGLPPPVWLTDLPPFGT